MSTLVKFYEVFMSPSDASLNCNQIKHKNPSTPAPKTIQSYLPGFQFSLHRFPQVIHYAYQHGSTPEPLFKTHLIKSSHRLISTPNLHLEECCFFPVASFLRTLHLRFLCIIPSSGSTKNIFSLLPREVLALVVSLLEYVLVGTSLAFEAIYGFMGVSVARGSGSSRGDCEDIAARGAD